MVPFDANLNKHISRELRTIAMNWRYAITANWRAPYENFNKKSKIKSIVKDLTNNKNGRGKEPWKTSWPYSRTIVFIRLSHMGFPLHWSRKRCSVQHFLKKMQSIDTKSDCKQKRSCCNSHWFFIRMRKSEGFPFDEKLRTLAEFLEIDFEHLKMKYKKTISLKKRLRNTMFNHVYTITERDAALAVFSQPWWSETSSKTARSQFYVNRAKNAAIERVVELSSSWALIIQARLVGTLGRRSQILRCSNEIYYRC